MCPIQFSDVLEMYTEDQVTHVLIATRRMATIVTFEIYFLLIINVHILVTVGRSITT